MHIIILDEVGMLTTGPEDNAKLSLMKCESKILWDTNIRKVVNINMVLTLTLLIIWLNVYFKSRSKY